MSGSELKRRLVPTADTDHTASERTHEMPASKTVTWDEIPDWQRDNRFILRGYRSATPKFRDILTSLTFMHNETCNVYTHLTGAVVLPFLAIPCWQYLSESRFSHVTGQDYTMFALFFCAAEICLVISTLYHLQMSHSHETEQFWLRMDLIGIIIAIEGTHISGINYIFPCEPKWQAVHWSTIIVSGLATAAMVGVPRFAGWRAARTIAYIALGGTSFIPLAHGVARYGYEDMIRYSGLKWYLVELAFYGGSALLYAFRLPERLSPGTFDIWGASHQIFHVAILSALCSHGTALIKAFTAFHSLDLCEIHRAYRSGQGMV